MSETKPIGDPLKFNTWKGVIASVDLRWRMLFIVVTFINACAAIVLVITAQDVTKEVRENRQVACVNFHLLNPNLPVIASCRKFVPTSPSLSNSPVVSPKSS